jgi:hypothetical protein
VNEARLEELTVALNRELYAEGAGLPFDETAMRAHAADLASEYLRTLDGDGQRPGVGFAQTPGLSAIARDMALDGLADAEAAGWDLQLAEAMDAAIVWPEVSTGGEPANWRNWKRADREIADPALRQALFDRFVEQSEALVPAIEGRYEARRRLYAEHGQTTPLAAYARRERINHRVLRDLVLGLGEACREAFHSSLTDLAAQVLGPGPVGAAELRALYLNRMYEPLAPVFAGRDPVADVRAALTPLGFSIDHIAMDFEDRPLKYPGASCFPVQVPGDVRVSVRPASPHHVADMLFHELGHAVHFAGIDAALPFADRYWIHSATHETYSTLFEMLLGVPEFLSEGLGFDAATTERLLAFDRFKFLLTATWQSVASATACDAWLEGLAWTEIEQRFAGYARRFTGIEFPAGYARLHPFVNDVEPYPLGYVVAAVRGAHWLAELEAEFGARWWRRRDAGDSIRGMIHPGGSISFDPQWLDQSAFVMRWVNVKRKA